MLAHRLTIAPVLDDIRHITSFGWQLNRLLLRRRRLAPHARLLNSKQKQGISSEGRLALEGSLSRGYRSHSLVGHRPVIRSSVLMMFPFQQRLHHLQHLNLEIRQRLEVAELKVGRVNPLLAQLAAAGLLNDTIVLGEVVLQRPYSVQADCTESGQFIQAALSVPGGFGAVLWDSEEFAFLRDTPQLESEAIRKAIPFEQCSSAIKALLLPQLEPLLDRLFADLTRR